MRFISTLERLDEGIIRFTRFSYKLKILTKDKEP